MKPYRLVSFLLLTLLLGARSAGAGVDCDAFDDFLGTGWPLSTFAGTGEFTVATWIKVQGTAPSATYCFETAQSLGDIGGYLALGRNGTGTFCGEVYADGTKAVTSAATAGWHHLALRLAAGTLSLWVNGVVGATIASGAPDDTTNEVRGCTNGAGALPPDRLEDPRWYTVAVPDAELETMGKSRIRGIGRTPASAHWHLDTCPDGASGQGHVFPDRTGNGRAMTGDDGGNDTGLTCHGAEWVSRPWGVH